VSAALPGRAHHHQLLAQLGCCGVASSSLSQCDWAACKQLSCLSHRLDLILTSLLWRCGC
jgi:hypothetical protein